MTPTEPPYTHNPEAEMTAWQAAADAGELTEWSNANDIEAEAADE